MYTIEPPQEGENRFVLRRAGQLGVIEIGWRTPEGRHEDIPALSVLDHILSAGVTSRLYQALVETQLALGATSHAYALLDPGLFTITITLRPGVTHEEVEQVIHNEIEKLKTDLATEAELRKAKNIILTHLIYLRDSPFGVVSALGEAEGMADWKDYVDFPHKIEAVTATDIQRVVQQYFVPDARTVGYFVPKN
jgi:zinc protease